MVEPGKTSYQSTLQVLGQMGSLYLEQTLKDSMVIGIGWGTSLAETVNNLPFLPLNDMRVIQVLGSVGGRSDPQVDGPGVASTMASRVERRLPYPACTALSGYESRMPNIEIPNADRANIRRRHPFRHGFAGNRDCGT